jgi:hypothetical protein
MHTNISGNNFIGYGILEWCPNCKNRIQQQVICSYGEDIAFFIRLPFTSWVMFPRVICGICGNVFSKDFSEITKILWKGREDTKSIFQKIGYFNRKQLIRHLKKLKFDDLSNYLISSPSLD